MSATQTTPAANSPATRPRSRFVAIVRYTFQSCLPFRRWVGLLVACGGFLLFGLLSLATDNYPGRFADIAADGILSLLMPVTALIIGDAMLGAEIRSGTFHFTWLSPAPTSQIVLGRWLGGAAIAAITIGPASAFAAIVGGDDEAIVPLVVAAVSGAITYVALFIGVACVTRRTAVWSLAIVFLVERLLGAALSGIAQISPSWLSRGVLIGQLDDPPRRLLREGVPEGTEALVRLAIVTAVSLFVAAWRMRHMRLSGASD